MQIELISNTYLSRNSFSVHVIECIKEGEEAMLWFRLGLTYDV